MRILPPAPVNLRLEVRKRGEMLLYVECLTFTFLLFYSGFTLTALAAFTFLLPSLRLLSIVISIISVVMIGSAGPSVLVDVFASDVPNCWRIFRWKLPLPEQAMLKELVKKTGVTPVVLVRPYPYSEPNEVCLRNARRKDKLDLWFTKRSVKNSLLIFKLLYDTQSLKEGKRGQERRRRAEAELRFHKDLGL